MDILQYRFLVFPVVPRRNILSVKGTPTFESFTPFFSFLWETYYLFSHGSIRIYHLLFNHEEILLQQAVYWKCLICSRYDNFRYYTHQINVLDLKI